MAHVQDLVFCNRDAEALARLLEEQRRTSSLEADASDALADLITEARLVADDALPPGYAALGSRVTFEGDGGPTRSVVLVEPAEADPANGRVSVLSPIGLALIGRRRGAPSDAVLPNGRRLALRLVETSAAVGK